MRSQSVSQPGGIEPKPMAGFFGGVNSMRLSWLLPDTQYPWSVNTVNRGGVVQTRFGYRQRTSLPAGLLQGGCYFQANKDETTAGDYLVVVIDGDVYALPYPFTTPKDWEPYRLKGLAFSKDAKMVYFAAGEKSASVDKESNLVVGDSYNILVIQDGTSNPGYWDGTTEGTANPLQPDYQIPIGTWMEWSGNRLWVAVNDSFVAGGDIGDPITFKERLGLGGFETKGDISVTGKITGMKNGVGTGRNSALYVMTENSTYAIQSSVLNRDAWKTTTDFQTTVFATIGCVAGRSIVNHAGLLWWYSSGGLVASDSAAAAFLTSQVKYKDLEMARSKRNFNNDLSGICAASFESYLAVGVPSGDSLNSQIMVLDYAHSSELQFESNPPAWQGVWTGIRPKQFADAVIGGQPKIYAFCTDYQSVDGETTFNHVWELFDPEQMDTHERINSAGEVELVKCPIYCEFESKMVGDTMDLKKFNYAEADLIELDGTVNLRISVRGNKGSYKEILKQKIVSTRNNLDVEDQEVRNIYSSLGYFSTQSRRVRTQNLSTAAYVATVESKYNQLIDKSFTLLFQWCGTLGLEMCRVFLEPFGEETVGGIPKDESGYNIVTINGNSIALASTSEQPAIITQLKSDEQASTNENLLFVAPFTPRYQEFFYSAIPVDWSDAVPSTVCLDCARDTFSPPLSPKLIYSGRVIV